eukprot:CAMPEP_0169403870 /NCGR_PEP_ID=MMETSP1017-20121227/56017_1 /TAXON_ID=342587 /ORGANISM="Karlodinium micrum, Strain CCMP2283" /LENGTH=67 /DNA_ID=CAMNT_0009510175 /DNA_START=43 /DNA_END=242 /DNA_ORIENTATION=+
MPSISLLDLSGKEVLRREGPRKAYELQDDVRVALGKGGQLCKLLHDSLELARTDEVGSHEDVVLTVV